MLHQTMDLDRDLSKTHEIERDMKFHAFEAFALHCRSPSLNWLLEDLNKIFTLWKLACGLDLHYHVMYPNTSMLAQHWETTYMYMYIEELTIMLYGAVHVRV